MADLDGLLCPAQIRRGRGQKLCDLDSLVSILIVSLVGTRHHSTPHPCVVEPVITRWCV